MVMPIESKQKPLSHTHSYRNSTAYNYICHAIVPANHSKTHGIRDDTGDGDGVEGRRETDT